ncbi:MAG: right-handed parallel beta-helix repeat-containing protein [Atribacterota bacterium]|nr:right-handed parallel beta-helix repeat-containing protein [Atribacterota bacterium]
MKKYLVLTFIVILVLAISGCAPFTPAPPTKATLTGQVVVPQGAVRQVGGQALPGATVNVIDPVTGDIIATTTTDANGNYQVEVPPGGPYIIEAVKGSIKVLDVSPQVEVGQSYDLGAADATSTAVALIFQAKVEAGEDPAQINLDEIAEDPKIDNLIEAIEEALAAGEDPTTAPEVTQVVEVIVSPPAPTPKPTASPTPPAPDTTPPTLKSLIAYLEDGTPRAAIGNLLEWTVGETVDYIVATASERVRLVTGANAVVTMSGEGMDIVYGTIAVNSSDATKLIITPYPGNEIAGLAGTFTFTVAAGVIEDYAGNKNEEVTVILKVAAKVVNVRTQVGYDTIQAAINGAAEGDTIKVAAGMYNSSIETFPITINKSLTLLGAQANVDPRPSKGGRSGSESIIDADETSQSVLQISSASDVEINGFTITGGTGDMVVGDAANNLLFCYNILYDDLGSSGDEAIQIKNSNGVVMEYNYAYNIVQDAFNLSESTNGVVRHNEAHDIHSENAAIYCYKATNIDIIGNLVYKVPYNDGIKLGDEKSGSNDGSTGGIVKDNEVHDAAQDGIAIYASGVTVENNTIYNCDSENGALYLYDADDSTVKKNRIYDNDAIGLLIKKSDHVGVIENDIYNNNDTNDTKYPGSAGIWLTSDTSDIVINENSITSNADFGVKNESGVVVDATRNWWGSASGPGQDGANGVSDNVTYSPWYVDEEMTVLSNNNN